MDNENSEENRIPLTRTPEKPRSQVRRGPARTAASGSEPASFGNAEATAAGSAAAAAKPAARAAARLKLPELAAAPASGGLLRPELFGHIPVKVTVELGETSLNLKEVLDLAVGSVIELEKPATQPLELKIKDQLIARGEVVVVDDAYGLRITEITSNE